MMDVINQWLVPGTNVILLGVTAWYAILTYRIANANKAAVAAMDRQILESTRPYVVFDFIEGDGVVAAEVRNTGSTAAVNLTIATDPGLRYLVEKNGTIEQGPMPEFAVRYSFLAPGMKERALIYNPGKHRALYPVRLFKITIHYQNTSGANFSDSYTLTFPEDLSQ